MATLQAIGPEQLRAAVVTYRDALRAHQDRLNRLNVYPVPDGDTGTNMALTLESVVTALEGASDMATTCKAISHGSLMGARGNSGVILSQVLRGLSAALALGDEGRIDGQALALALGEASTAAYSAVMHPVEGTILTVVRESAGAAADTIAAGSLDLVDVLEAAAKEAEASVARTPELLPVLAEAGVVDAGGAGFALLLDSLLHVVDGRPVPAPPPMDRSVVEATAASTQSTATATAADDDGHAPADGPRYEVMFLLDAPDDTIESFKSAWDAIGESIVVVGGEGLWNCHIHADDIGAAIEAGIEVGRPRRIAVTDLMDQVHEEQWVRQHLEPQPEHPAVRTAVVAVAAGTGAIAAFRSLGVQQVVAGGQSMNPSTADLVAAVEATSGEEVILLPNNKNIVPVAMQVGGLADRIVVVLPTRSVVEGAAAMLAYDPAGDAAANLDAMTASSAHVVCGHVTRAVRDSNQIKQHDWLGVANGEVVANHADLSTACCTLLDRLVEPNHELVTVIEGEGATGDASAEIAKWLAEHRSGVTVEVERWDQPLSAYLFSIE